MRVKGDEDLRRPPLAGEAVDHRRNTVARGVDEQFVAGRVRLANRLTVGIMAPVASLIDAGSVAPWLK